MGSDDDDDMDSESGANGDEGGSDGDGVDGDNGDEDGDAGMDDDDSGDIVVDEVGNVSGSNFGFGG